ncbi:hypothetical protein CORT_0E03000 [Candida orthopsilosis Co 90-125]|uniref:Uncharacterized protein n=1 Tax=Candida orthopsilosis (strain 90-125) TaxID=1136231 RepID=H8X7V3_CANO9|nr:hypothetical protein CORT_0E03000 [Candida orthopsilosis Co 90-125]CCG23889.1 hypothetical protein CORT_0E03000 [Candida orthopsilosis Co 90-125]
MFGFATLTYASTRYLTLKNYQMVFIENMERPQTHQDVFTTSISTLDDILFNSSYVKGPIFDLQSTPSCHGMYIVISSLIISNLTQERPVVIIDTSNKFPFHLLKNHPQFKLEFKSNITHCVCDTFAKLYSVISSKTKFANGSMIVINEFHSLLESYKLEMSMSYEETILKNYVENNSTLINNKFNGTKDPIVKIPPSSDLLKISPISKYESHVNLLFRNLNSICTDLNATIYLLGYLETKYRPYKLNNTIDASQLSYSEKGRIVLSPSVTHKSCITKLLLYLDWYHKTPHFFRNYPIDNTRQITINQAMLKLVNVVKVTTKSESFGPIYFDVDDEFYYDQEEEFTGEFKVRDLSETMVESCHVIPSSPNIDASIIHVTSNDLGNTSSSNDTEAVASEIIEESEEEIAISYNSATDSNNDIAFG